MRYVVMAVMLILIGPALMSQEDSPKPTLSNEPLTNEQLAVYRAVLGNYLKDSDGKLNLANRTDPLDRSRLSDGRCMKAVEQPTANSAQIIHRIDSSSALGAEIVLVDPDRQRDRIEENDPQNLMKRAVDGHEEVTEKQVDDSVKHAFETGIFTLSEIVFDKEHRRAVVAYSFVCGMLCGNGSTLLLRKVGTKWTVSKTCGGWVS
jgi:hypothetical protein